jgi:hypothetical protein
MPTTQSEDPNEQVNHPRWYNNHPSGIEAIELIEHLPANLSHAFKYIWRCGLKQSSTPLRDLQSALWYVEREQKRVRLHELEDAYEEPLKKTDVVWRAHAMRVCDADEGSVLSACLYELLAHDIWGIVQVLRAELDEMMGARREET